MTWRRPAEGTGFTRESHDHTPRLLPRLSAQRTPSQRVMTAVAHTFELALGLSQCPKATQQCLNFKSSIPWGSYTGS